MPVGLRAGSVQAWATDYVRLVGLGDGVVTCEEMFRAARAQIAQSLPQCAEFVNEAMDNFVKAADASVAEVGDLKEALSNIGPDAARLGFSIEDVNTALALLSTRGIRGRSLRNAAG